MKKPIKELTNKQYKKLLDVSKKLEDIFIKTEDRHVLYCAVVTAIGTQYVGNKNKVVKNFTKMFSKDLKRVVKSMNKFKQTGAF